MRMAPGRAEEVIVIGVPAARMDKVRLAVTDCVDAESLTVTAIGKLPLAVGTPKIWPVGARMRPLGRLPEAIDHVYGAVPPVACSVPEYDEPVRPIGNDKVVIARGAGAMVCAAVTVRVKVALAVCVGELESMTDTENEYVPAVVGVPEITPVSLARVSPAGSCPAARLHVYAAVPPTAAIVAV